MATNGRILIMSETLPRNVLHVWDVRDKAHPVEIAAVSSDTEFESANHTMSCLFDCTWLWGSDGAIVDLRNPGDPKVIQRNWMEGLPGEDGHDVEEVKPGFVLTSTDPWMYLDARDPAHPRLLAVGPDVGFVHSALWPRGARDRFAFTVGENNFTPRCELNEAFFRSWDTRRWRRTHTFQEVDRLELSNGTYQDGNPAVNGLGCSTHWFEENPTYANGGIVAMAAYEHGTRFLRIGRDGAIGEVGWFVPYAGSTSAPHWATDRIVYAIDYTRGLDVLRFTGEL
ncbi:MAG: hypothetical protein HY658_01525 [Actinobacteria bacterium]|nr:hypothetical protein [Actinomycetota bacterium]